MIQRSCVARGSAWTARCEGIVGERGSSWVGSSSCWVGAINLRRPLMPGTIFVHRRPFTLHSIQSLYEVQATRCPTCPRQSNHRIQCGLQSHAISALMRRRATFVSQRCPSYRSAQFEAAARHAREGERSHGPRAQARFIEGCIGEVATREDIGVQLVLRDGGLSL